jgi:hypothetical protein
MQDSWGSVPLWPLATVRFLWEAHNAMPWVFFTCFYALSLMLLGPHVFPQPSVISKGLASTYLVRVPACPFRKRGFRTREARSEMDGMCCLSWPCLTLWSQKLEQPKGKDGTGLNQSCGTGSVSQWQKPLACMHGAVQHHKRFCFILFCNLSQDLELSRQMLLPLKCIPAQTVLFQRIVSRT